MFHIFDQTWILDDAADGALRVIYKRVQYWQLGVLDVCQPSLRDAACCCDHYSGYRMTHFLCCETQNGPKISFMW